MSNIQERLDHQLLNACRYGHVSEVDILLSKGANINYSDCDDPFGATCLSEASRRGKSEIVQLLIDRGVSVNDKISHDITALHLACERGHILVVNVLLKNKCNSCPQELFNLDTPLHYAAANDHENICKLLITNGNVNVNIQNRTGDTPLHIAVANDRLKSTTMLLTLGGRLDITNHAGMNVIILAQLAKCKHSIEAMQPYINKMKQNEANLLKIKQEKLVKSRKNTIKKTIDATDEDVVVVVKKNDMVFKKGFLQKQGKKFKHFHERYFILWSNGLMNYYSKEHTIFANYIEKSKLKNTSTSKCDDDNSIAIEEEEKENLNKKRKNIKRKSTLHKLGLKSDVIKPKGIIDVINFNETQFLEFANDNSPGWALITPEREWKFKCKNDRERREWIAAVHAVNYGISPFDFMNINMNISYKHNNNTMLLEPNNNSFINKKQDQHTIKEEDAAAQGWMYKLGAAVRGLEQNYWKKRWVSLYKKPPRLAYSLHPYTNTDNDGGNGGNNDDIKGLKGVIQLNDVTNIIKIGNNNIIKNKYRAPTVHVFALITDKRTWVFSCKTIEECTMWYDRISFFLPNQWKQQNNNINVEELLRFNRVKTIANENEIIDEHNNNNLTVDNNNKNNGDDTVMSKLFRKVSNVAETLGITEQYSTISGVQPKGSDIDNLLNTVQN